MNPVLAASQIINVARKGEEPPMWDAQEDVTLMFPDAVVGRGGGSLGWLVALVVAWP